MKVQSLLALFLFTVLSSCGPLFTSGEDTVLLQGQSRQFATADPTFNSYIQTFVAQAQNLTQNSNFSIGDVPVNFGDTENESFDGVCFIYSNGDREVIIKKDWWIAANESKREMMIFHELGHCRLGREHNSTLHSNEIGTYKESVMHPLLPDSLSYNQFKTGYMSELFTEQTSALLNLLGIN